MRRAILATITALSWTLLFAAAPAFAAQGDHPEPDPKPTPTDSKAPAEPGVTPVPNRPAAIEGGSLYSVQSRRFHPGHEFRLAAGYLPQDAFYKGTTVDFSYGYHFNDFFSLELLRGVYSWNHDTDLVQRLAEEFDVENDPYEKVQYLISTHAVITPFYGKHAVLNRRIVHQELYFLGGVGGVGWVIHENGRSDRPTSFRPALDLGFGFRWYASKAVSFKLEGIENLYQKEDGSIDDQVYVTFGISLSTGR